MSKFDQWWQTEGIRLLGPDNKPPTLEERCRAAYQAGIADQCEEWQLPEGTHLAAVSIPEEEVE